MDGGITVLLHCQGFKPSTKLCTENITVEAYVSPRELNEGGKQISEDVAFLVQDFGNKIVIPHIHRFLSRCKVDNVIPPREPSRLLFSNQSYALTYL